MTIQDNPALFASSSDAASTVAASSQQTSTVVTVPAESDAEMASRLQIQYAIAVDIPSDMNKTKQQFPSEHSSQNYITTSSRNEAVATATNTYALPAGHSHTNLPGVYAIPIQYGTSDGVPPVVVPSEESILLLKTQGISRGMKTLALIDGFFLMIVAMQWPICFIFIWGPYCGFTGSKHYRLNSIRVYMCYRFLRIVADIVNLSEDPSNMYSCFSFLVDILVFYYANTFLVLLKTLTEPQVAKLQTGEMLRDQGRQAFYSVY